MGSEMQERIARAIYEGRNGRGCAPWGRVAGAHKAPYFSDALAAMRAMREPTRAMIDAAYAAHDAYEASDPPAAWCGLSSAFKAMLDAEIKKAEEG